MKIENSILRGFYPDPSIIRVGEDYYLATSTFEWWSGVAVHHSRDLKNWELLTYPLNRVSQLDLRGVGASQGVWAPCLTYCEGIYYLVYTVVHSFYCNMYDTNNYLVTAGNIMGPWSEPIALNNFGFDPSLFHDTDGRKYMVSMVTDHRVPKKYAGRLVLQEYSPKKKCMIGKAQEIYTADKIFLEGPHIFKRGDYYYLFSADTGTGEAHGQTIQRSRSVWGPYEMYRADFMERTQDNEAYSILTTRHHPDYPLQKAGHCDLVETQTGEWYAVHLCGRPLEKRNSSDTPRFADCRRYPLGRETAIQKMRWTKDDWLEMANGTSLPEVIVEGPDLEEHPFFAKPVRDDFNKTKLDLCFQSLRIPMDEYYLSLTKRVGYLRLYGREGLGSKFAQSLIARRWSEFLFEASTKIEFAPEVFKQMAGLICLYDNENYFYLHLTWDEEIGKCLTLLRSENKKCDYPIGFLSIPENCAIYLRVSVHYDTIVFFYAIEENQWILLGESYDCSFLSDEACKEGWFTGAMVGLCCQDLTGAGVYADFDWFEYKTGERKNDE